MAEYDRLTAADDRAILRSLAEAVREIAADPANNEEKIHQWKSTPVSTGNDRWCSFFPTVPGRSCFPIIPCNARILPHGTWNMN